MPPPPASGDLRYGWFSFTAFIRLVNLILELVCNVTRARTTFVPVLVHLQLFLCRVTGKHASNWWRDIITLTFDLWPLRSPDHDVMPIHLMIPFTDVGHRTPSLYQLPSLKSVRLAVPKTADIRSGVKWPGDLDLWRFDLGADAERQPWHDQPFCQFLFLSFSENWRRRADAKGATHLLPQESYWTRKWWRPLWAFLLVGVMKGHPVRKISHQQPSFPPATGSSRFTWKNGR